jgi:hypothetical protein
MAKEQPEQQEQHKKKIVETQRELDKLKEQSLENIELVLNRGTKINDLVETTKNLAATSFAFKKTTREMKDQVKGTCCCFSFWSSVKENVEEKIMQVRHDSQRPPGYGSIQ